MKKIAVIQIILGLFALALGLLENGYSMCRPKVAAIGISPTDGPAPYARRNGSAISRVLLVLKAKRDITPQSIYLVVVDPFKPTCSKTCGGCRALAESEDAGSAMVKNFVTTQNKENAEAYRIQLDSVLTSRVGNRNIVFMKATGAPSSLVQLVETVREIKWIGWEDPQFAVANNVTITGVTVDGKRITEIRLLDHLPYIVGLRANDRITRFESEAAESLVDSIEFYVVVSAELNAKERKIVESKGDRIESILTLQGSEFKKFQTRARAAGFESTIVDGVRFQNIVGTLFRVKGNPRKLENLLSDQPSITWVSKDEMPSFAP